MIKIIPETIKPPVKSYSNVFKIKNEAFHFHSVGTQKVEPSLNFVRTYGQLWGFSFRTYGQGFSLDLPLKSA
jgi:hypothetical protein